MQRSEVQENLKWDLNPLYPSDESWEQDYQSCQELLPTITNLIEKMFDSGDDLLNLFQFEEKITRNILKLYMYAHLNLDADTANTTSQTRFSKIINLYSAFSGYVAPITPKILTKSTTEIEELISQNESLQLYDTYLKRILKEKDHILSENEESLLANALEILNASGATASTLMNADTKYPMIVDEDGNEVRLTNGLFAQLLHSKNREKRKEAFEKLYSSYDGIKNTLAKTLYTNTKKNVFIKNARKYRTSREMFLSENEVPEAVYDTLLKVINDKIYLLHDYVDLRSKILGLDEITAYDMYVPIVDDVDIKYTIDQAKDITLKALAPLGKEYISILEKAFNEKWIDWSETEGKRSGAYSSGSYDTNPYILMNWQDTINQLYTLVHELGHSVHSYYSRNTQPFIYSSYPIFLAEIASTTNENLLTEYLLKTETDPKVRAYIINHYLDGVKATIFRQAQFAEFEYRVHTAVENGEPFTHESFSELYAEINSKYYGKKMNSTNEIKLEWARIPHFYNSFYVFQYATGFAAASALSQKILNGDEKDLENYITFLKSGCCTTPIEIMKKAGVDMTNEAYLIDALNVFEKRLKQLDEVLK